MCIFVFSGKRWGHKPRGERSCSSSLGTSAFVIHSLTHPACLPNVRSKSYMGQWHSHTYIRRLQLHIRWLLGLAVQQLLLTPCVRRSPQTPIPTYVDLTSTDLRNTNRSTNADRSLKRRRGFAGRRIGNCFGGERFGKLRRKGSLVFRKGKRWPGHFFRNK